jgi:NAD(P)-dependent dehydrogenase (short-subunit alcohol dehydrogenase family)
VYAHGRVPAAGAAVAGEIGGVFLPGDLSRLDDVHRLADDYARREPALDILVNNAAYEVHGPLAGLDLGSARTPFDVNCWRAVALTVRLLPRLRASSRASVIDVTSIHESTPVAENAPNAMIKAAGDVHPHRRDRVGPDGRPRKQLRARRHRDRHEPRPDPRRRTRPLGAIVPGRAGGDL